MGASWKCNFPPFNETITNRGTGEGRGKEWGRRGHLLKEKIREKEALLGLT